jgi:hypothetical protein
MSGEQTSEEFRKIIDDFTRDLSISFPEYKKQFESIDYLSYHKHCKSVYPENFFNILYENNELFDDVKSKFLLPNIDFYRIMNDEGLSDASKKTIWKYLQLVLFCVCNGVNDKKDFGDANYLFEAIDENELHGKIQETMNEMKNVFMNMSTDMSMGDMEDFANVFSDMSGAFMDSSFNAEGSESSNMFENMMDADQMKDHLSGIMNGKIGNLAKEIAEEAAKELGIDEENMTPEDQQSFMKNLFKNPMKLLNIVKNIGAKLEEKFKSGDLKESELLEEAKDIMDKMKDMPGLKNMMNSMGLNPGGKFDFKGMAGRMQSSMRQAKQRERMQEKLKKRQEEQSNSASENMGKAVQVSEDTFVWNDDNSNPNEPMKKSSSAASSGPPKKKGKKKGKKKVKK